MSFAPHWHPTAAAAVPVLRKEDIQLAASVFRRMAEERGASQQQAKRISLAAAELATEITMNAGHGHIQGHVKAGVLELRVHDGSSAVRSLDDMPSEESVGMARRLLDGLELFPPRDDGLRVRGWCVLEARPQVAVR